MLVAYSSCVSYPIPGYEVLLSCFPIAMELGVREITAYALSIENLNRSAEELEGLWQIVEAKFTQFRDQIPAMQKRGFGLRIIGNWALFPAKLQKVCAEIMVAARNLKDPVLVCNVAICYTSRDEITASMRTIVDGVVSGQLLDSDVDAAMMERDLEGASDYPPDMIVRTSGETRLSDFLLWQSEGAVLYFTDVLWPDFGYWDMLKLVLYYQYVVMRNPVAAETEQPLPPASKSIINEDGRKSKRLQNWMETRRERFDEMIKNFAQVH